MKKMKLFLPYFALAPIVPLYAVLDRNVFLKIFGCGCVPVVQSNILNIPFNANDLRYTVYWILTALITLWAAKMSKHFANKAFKAIYILSVFAVNAFITSKICVAFMWK